MNAIFIENLCSLIKSSGETQFEICKKMGIRPQKMTNWKSGYTEPNLDDLLRIADYFDVSIDSLLGRVDELGIVVEPGRGPQLAAEEQEILALYRRMDHSQRIRFQGFGEGLVESGGSGTGKTRA